MAQYGGEKYGKEEGHHHTGGEHGNNPLYSTTGGQEKGTEGHHNIGGVGTDTQYPGTEGHHNIGGVGTGIGTGGGHGCEEGKHGAAGGGILHRSGSGSSSSSESDGEGGRRKKSGVMGKIKGKLPGGGHGSDEHKTSANVEGGYGHKTPANVEGGGYGHEGAGHEDLNEKKGLMDKIKEKLPGGHK